MSIRKHRHDLVVIGGGSAGLVAADFGARYGADVLLIEKSKIGGDCTWTGCVPSKALLHAAGVAHQLRAASDVGVCSGGDVNFPEVLRRVRDASAAVYSFETPDQLRSRGIEVEVGEAHFLDQASVDVSGRRIRARNFIICTGAVPQRPPIPGLEAVRHLTYEEVFDLEELPGRLLVLGGGPVGVELAQAFSRLGSEVTLAERENRLLPQADREAADMLTRRLSAEGVRVETGLELEKVTQQSTGEVTAESTRGRLTADRLLVATGRHPEIEGLDLAHAEVDYDQRGIHVDRNLKTSRDHIYAAGDATGAFQFTHYAGWQGYVAARNALFPGSVRGVAETVPWAVFTQPELAQVGLTEDQAREQSRGMAIHRLPLERVDRAQTSGETEGFIKIVATQSGKVPGGTIVAPAAGPTSCRS